MTFVGIEIEPMGHVYIQDLVRLVELAHRPLIDSDANDILLAELPEGYEERLTFEPTDLQSAIILHRDMNEHRCSCGYRALANIGIGSHIARQVRLAGEGRIELT